MSDLATRNRSFFPPERMRSTALQGAATGREVSSGSLRLAALQEPAKSWTFTKHPPLPITCPSALCLLRVTSRGCFSPAYSFVEGLAFRLVVPE